jgi:putative membrane protein insertion efficiency factor
VKGAALALLRFYKRNISPTLPPACRYEPTCSVYAQEAIEKKGIVVGIGMALWRLVRCNPWSKGGYDPVPGAASSQEQIAGDGPPKQ